MEEYVALFSLVCHKPKPISWMGCGVVKRELKQFKCPKVGKKNLEQLVIWLQNIDGNSPASPDMVGPSKTYLDITHHAYNSFVG